MKNKTNKKRRPAGTALSGDAALIAYIVDRAHEFMLEHCAPLVSFNADKLAACLKLCHEKGCRLRLQDMAEGSIDNLMHDALGIMRHIDPATGDIGSFLPRYAAPETKQAAIRSAGYPVERLIKDARRAWDDVMNGLRLLGYHQASEEWALHFLASKGINVKPGIVRAKWAIYQRQQEQRAAGEEAESTAEEATSASGKAATAETWEYVLRAIENESTPWLCDLMANCGLHAWLKSAAEKGQAIVYRRTFAKRTDKGRMELRIHAQLAPAAKH